MLALNFATLQYKTNSSKEKIISILSSTWPLTAKKIFLELKSEFNFSGSYQAVHKLLVELQREGIVEKTLQGFHLDKNWIENLSNFIQTLKKSYEQNIPLKNNELNGIAHLKFNSFIEFARFLINDFYANTSLNPEKKVAACFWSHSYPAIGVGELEHENLKKILSYTTHYAICRNNTVADRFFSDYLEKLGKKSVNGVDFSVKNDTFVHGDYVLQAFFPPKMNTDFDNLFAEIKEIDDLNLQKIFNFTVDKKYGIEIIIFKNKEFADTLRTEAEKIYKEGKK